MDRFRVLQSLGEGGAGRVLLVEDRLRPGSRLALKEIHDDDPEHAEALRREFATLATLRHPSLVEAFELEVDPGSGRPRFTMERVEGDDIVTTVRREGADALMRSAAEALRALAFLHDFGWVHRDLKPGNLLVRRSPKAGLRVVILDFGLAAERGGDGAALTPAMAGTLPYMAPELFDGGAPTKRTDLYALAAVLFEAIHGRTPFVLKGGGVAGFVAAVREGRRARPASPSGFPSGLARWLDEMLAPDPSDRPSSAIDALARLNERCGADFALETIDDRAARLGSGEPVGRPDELASLRREVAPSDAPRVAWLCGDAGSGKSRLLRFLASEAIGQGWRVHAPPGALPASADDFVERVRAEAAAGPTLVLLDELERADNAVAAFIDRIAREPRQAPVHVVAAFRPGELAHPRLKKLLADTGVVPSLARVDLAPMGEPGLKAMIDRATAGRSSAQARVKWLLDASEGNAGAAEALLVEGVWEKRGKIPVAAALEQSIRRRLDAMSAEARSWLEALAVLGDDAPEALVGELAGLEERAAPAAEAAIAAGLARRTGAHVGPDSRRVAEAVRAAASPERWSQLHALAATHYAAQERDAFGATAWRLARLWRGAGETDRAVAAALDAASAAEIANDWAEAAQRVRFALTLLPRRDPRRAELWMRLAEALRQGALHPESIKAFGAVARHVSGSALGRLARAKQARSLLVIGRLKSAEQFAQTALRAATLAADPLSRAAALEVLAGVLIQRLDGKGALALAMQGLAVVPDDAHELKAYLLHSVATAEWRLGMSDATGHHETAIAICRDHGFEYAHMILLLGRAYVLERNGELDAAAAVLAEAERLAETRGDPGWLRRVVHQRSRVALYEDRFDLALRLARSSQELSVYAGDAINMLGATGILATALDRCGRRREALDVVRHALASPLSARSQFWCRYLEVELAWTMADDVSAHDECRQLLDRAETALASAGPIVLADILTTRLRVGMESGASNELSQVVHRFDALAAENTNRLHRSSVALFRMIEAIWRLRQKQYDAAVVAAEASISGFDTLMPSFRGRAQFALADALGALGRHDDSEQARLAGRDFMELATSRIVDAEVRRDFLGQPLIRDLLATLPAPAENRRLDALYDMIRALNSETDPEALLASSLEMAMKAVEAERGMILLSGPTGSDFSVRLSKNLEKETQADAETFSRRIVAQAEKGESILALDAGQDERFKDFKSVSLFRIRSLMCVPLKSRGRIIGTVYLDSRRQGRLFGHDDLRFVEAFADHAALALENARRRAELEHENRRLRAVAGERSSYASIVGRSPAMQKVFDLLERVAPSDMTVLIQGESGTGKELVARALHFNGPRKDKAFHSENCAAISESLLESELFGHVKGAFTGAERDREGLFEQAHGGTLFLDEIGDMSQGMQARLLRVLQEGELRRVGGEHSVRVDVRVIAATNKDLQAAVAANRFREDLYYRLAVVPVTLPPLRERIGDVPFLAAHLVAQIAAARGRPTPRIESDVLDAMERYAWPGNVRQLENLLRRMSLLAGDGAITRGVVESDPELARMLFGKQAAVGPLLSLEKTEEEQIRRALEAAAGNRDRAARLLGISRATIYRKMREYGLR